VDNPESELERSADWIGHDPDFYFMYEHKAEFTKFKRFLEVQKHQDYPVEYVYGECPIPHPDPVSIFVGREAALLKASPLLQSPVRGPAPSVAWQRVMEGGTASA
jgi:hypothetical protein